MACKFFGMKVDVIVTVGSAVPTVRQATSVIPIVFAVAIDPVANGLVASLAKPGGNVTGLSLQAANLAGKRIELLREVVPQLSRLAIIFNGGNAQPVLEMGETEATARTLGVGVAPLDIRRGEDFGPAFPAVEVAPLEIRRVEDFSPAFQAIKAKADALYVAIDQLMVANLMRILTLALGARLPTIFSTRDFVRGGVLCPMDQVTRNGSGARQITLIKF